MEQSMDSLFFFFCFHLQNEAKPLGKGRPHLGEPLLAMGAAIGGGLPVFV